MEKSSNFQENLISTEHFYNSSIQHFSKACEALNHESRFFFSLAKKEIVIKSAGHIIQKLTCQALKHIEIFALQSNIPSLEILVWDEKESKINMPTQPWETPSDLVEDSFVQFHLEHFFVCQYDNQSILYIYNQQKNQAICILKDAKTLNNSFISSPYFKIIAIWASHQSLNILHAGCVSEREKGVLIVGRSGKGKSSTSIQCLIGGLNYLSDDYILVDLYGEKPIAYSIFNSGKLNLKHIDRFNKIKGKYTEGILDKNNKPLLFLYPLFANQISKNTEIKAIIVPNITSEIKTSYHPISAAESLRSLAPSTLVQLKINNLNHLNSLANLTRSLPNFTLNVGSDFDDISSKVKELIATL